MSFKNVGKQLIEEVPYGMYVWEAVLPDGTTWVVQDDDANVMNVFCMKGDQKSIDYLRQAARYYGFPNGKAVFWSGRRRIDDEELEYQVQRQAFGLEPDPLNVPGMIDDAKERQAYGR